MSDGARRDDGKGRGSAGGRIEWVAAALSALVVVALMTALLREAADERGALPDLVATAEPPAARGPGRSLVRFAVANRGDRAAAAVGVALDLRRGEALLDRRRVTIDYVAAHSEARGGFYLDRLPEDAEIVVTVEGYVEP